MIDLNEIKKYFPQEVHEQEKSMLREYLQCLALSVISESQIAKKLTFRGGTALRIIYNTKRFSDDLNFDNKGLELEEWTQLASEIQSSFNQIGIQMECTKVRLNDTVFHTNLRFPGLYFQYGLSPYKTETLLIKTDSQDQGINYQSEIADINKFEVRCKIKTMPLDIALSQKFRAFFDREMGRDLFDISSIAPQTKPNYDYLKQALGISSATELKEAVLKRCDELDLEKLIERARPFLFQEKAVDRILYFKDYMKSYKF